MVFCSDGEFWAFIDIFYLILSTLYGSSETRLFSLMQSCTNSGPTINIGFLIAAEM
jgi:hypothetical protein